MPALQISDPGGPGPQEARHETTAGCLALSFRPPGDAVTTMASIRRLLVVDDEAVQRLIVARAAEALGFVADAAATLGEAVRLVTDSAYDVVVLDLALSDRDGIELLRTLRHTGADPVLIFVSGFDERVRQAAARLAGAQGLRVAGTLGKPLMLDQLLLLLRSLPERMRVQRASSPDEIDPGELAGAIARDEIHCLFQPKVALSDGRFLGVEALARWHSPRLGVVMPDVFIPMAERYGLIDQLTYRVLGRALAAFRPWLATRPAISLAVNLSPLSLTDLSLPERVSDLLGRSGVPSSALVLEVTESAVMAEYVVAADILTRLRIRGIRLSIDDFGTGHSSLLSLLRLPFSELKIDQSFVRNCGTDPEAPKMIRAIVSLARELQLQLVAEGIETQESADLMARLGCTVGQGYLFDRPLTAATITARTLGRVPHATP
jgi:EAL domain-containing protein (putative c-di-GMP-specific phosphodiesterase class I)/ActR/RegA family two-component response regulator